MNILIIGGTGLISTAITAQLVAARHQVTHFNRGQTSSAVTQVQALHGDRKDFAAFEAQMQSGPVYDCVIDMICFHPAEAESLVRAFHGKTKQLILCSTVDVYARPQRNYPIPENAPRGGVSAYGKAKVLCEDIVLAAGSKGGLSACVLRPVHTVDDRGRLHHSFGKADTRYFDRLQRGLPVIVHGDGSSLWTTCHAQDAATAFVSAVGNSKTFGNCYHLPGRDTLTWNDFHQRAAATIGAPAPQLVHIPTDVLAALSPERAAISLENFQFNNCFDAAKTRADLGYNPQISFEECIRRIHVHMVSNKLIENAANDELYARVVAAWQKSANELTRTPIS